MAVHVKEHQEAEISGDLQYGVSRNNVVGLWRKTSEWKPADMALIVQLSAPL